MSEGIIVLSHGSRNLEAQIMLDQILLLLQTKKPEACIKGAFLEFNQPDLGQALRNMAEQGVGKILVLPLFLLWGRHIMEHIPAILNQVRKLYPDLELKLADPLGADARIAEILWDRWQELESGGVNY